jgi:hypothetical protein
MMLLAIHSSLRPIHRRRDYYCFVFGLGSHVAFTLLLAILLLLLLQLDVIHGGDTQQQQQQQQQQHPTTASTTTGVSTSSTSTCTVMPDGSCLEEDNPSSGRSSSNSSDIEQVVPIPDKDGYITTQYGEKQLMVSTSFFTNGKITKQQIQQRFELMHQYMYRLRTSLSTSSSNSSTGTTSSSSSSSSSSSLPSGLLTTCQNRDDWCVYWATIGECDTNPKYMKLHCAPACLSCEELVLEKNCPMSDNYNETNIWKSGDLQTFYENITTHPYYAQRYGPITIHSSPTMIVPLLLKTTTENNEDTTNTDTIDSSSSSSSSSSSPPWLVTIDNFLTDKECNTLIQLGNQLGYQPSLDIIDEVDGGPQWDSDGLLMVSVGAKTTRRTSTNIWCLDDDNCTSLPIIKDIVVPQFYNLTNIPDGHYEHFQFIRYHVGQSYQRHHDYLNHHIHRPAGVRIITVLVYLNDVKAGNVYLYKYHHDVPSRILLNYNIIPQSSILISPFIFDIIYYQTKHTYCNNNQPTNHITKVVGLSLLL